MELTDIHSILIQITNKIDNIENVVNNLNHKLCKVEDQMESMKHTQHQPHQTQVAMFTSISTSEEKIKLLNQKTNISTQGDLLETINSQCVISESGVLAILDQSVTIYEHIVDVVYDIDNDSVGKYIYGFSDSKNSLYYWNHSKKTWAKMTKAYLYDIFMEIQKKIIFKYNELMEENESLKHGCVEHGDLIFANDFEKRHGDFKKSIISRFV